MRSHLPSSLWGKGPTVPGTASKVGLCLSSKRRSVVAEALKGNVRHAVCQDNSSTALARSGQHGM
jgi:hypothetical protein